MKLKEALDAYKPNTELRIKNWPVNACIPYDCKNNYLMSQNLNRNDLVADDWEIITDKKEQLKEKIKNLISVFDNSYDFEDAPDTGNYEKDLFDFIETLEIK